MALICTRNIKTLSRFIACSFLFFPLVGVAQQQLSFGVYATDKPSSMYAVFEPVIKALEQQIYDTTGEPIVISLRVFKDYQEGLERLKSGKVDFMRLGPASYILAKQSNPDIALLAMEMRKGSKRFNGVIIVPEESDITSLAQLKGKRFAFGNQNSTIGRYLSQAKLMSEGIYGKDLAHYAFLGRHDNVAAAVGVKRFDAGAVKENTFHKMAEEHKLRAIAYFNNVTKPWVARAGIDPKWQKAISSALLSLNDKKALTHLKVDRFTAAADHEYDFVRKGMAVSKTFD